MNFLIFKRIFIFQRKSAFSNDDIVRNSPWLNAIVNGNDFKSVSKGFHKPRSNFHGRFRRAFSLPAIDFERRTEPGVLVQLSPATQDFSRPNLISSLRLSCGTPCGRPWIVSWPRFALFIENKMKDYFRARSVLLHYIVVALIYRVSAGVRNTTQRRIVRKY